MSLKEVCRACLCSGRTMCSLLESIVPKFDSPPDSVVDLWKIFTKMLITHEDRFPNKICMECLDEIQRTYSFMVKCKRSDDTLKRLKVVSVVSEPNSDIVQIKTENIEMNDTKNKDADRQQFVVYIQANDNQIERRSQGPLMVQLDCENVVRKDEAIIQNIKREPELDICMENDAVVKIKNENSSITEIFICPACRYQCQTKDSLEKHLIENHIEGQMCKLCNQEFECTAIQHCCIHLDAIQGIPITTKIKQHTSKEFFAMKSDLTAHYHGVNNSTAFFQQQQQNQHHESQHQVQLQQSASQPLPYYIAAIVNAAPQQYPTAPPTFDASIDFSKYLRHPDYDTADMNPANQQLLVLDSNPLQPPGQTFANNSADLDNFDHDLSECSNSSNQMNVSKPLTKFVVNDDFEVHPAHKVEEGIFQHMNKLPLKKKETLKQLGATLTGHISINDKSIIVENFAKFCQDYGVTDHRPFLTLNQSGMQKTEQIKFARYLGQGLPYITLFCIYINFKNLFGTKRFENYSKTSYNLQYILDKTKQFLTCPRAETPTATITNNNISGAVIQSEYTRSLERLTIFENHEVHESHRIEDGIFTHIGRLSEKKQELLKQFGIQSNPIVSYYEKHIIIENFTKFCHEYNITDHRPFLDFNESGLPKIERIKFARYLGQGVSNLTLYKIYSTFKDILALNRIEKLIVNGYNLETILKKKKKNLVARSAKRAIKLGAQTW